MGDSACGEFLLTGSCLCPNSTPSGNGVRTGSFSPGAFFLFFGPALRRVNPPGANRQRKINMKLQNLIHILMGIVCIGLLPRAQAVSPPPPAPRGLSQLHHCCGGPRPSGSHLGPWEHSNWYVFVV